MLPDSTAGFNIVHLTSFVQIIINTKDFAWFYLLIQLDYSNRLLIWWPWTDLRVERFFFSSFSFAFKRNKAKHAVHAHLSEPTTGGMEDVMCHPTIFTFFDTFYHHRARVKMEISKHRYLKLCIIIDDGNKIA